MFLNGGPLLLLLFVQEDARCEIFRIEKSYEKDIAFRTQICLVIAVNPNVMILDWPEGSLGIGTSTTISSASTLTAAKRTSLVKSTLLRNVVTLVYE